MNMNGEYEFITNLQGTKKDTGNRVIIFNGKKTNHAYTVIKH